VLLLASPSFPRAHIVGAFSHIHLPCEKEYPRVYILALKGAEMKVRRVTSKPKKDGSVKVSYLLDYVDEDGNRCRPHFDTRTQAIEVRDRLIQEKVGPGKKPPYLFSDAAEDYLKICEKIGRDGKSPIEADTVKGYRSNIENHILPEFGKMDISNLTAPDVVQFRDWLITDCPAGAETKRFAFLHFRAVLQEAYNRGRVKSHVWGGVKLNIKDRKPVRSPFDDDLESKAKIPSKTEAALLLETAASLRADPRALMGWTDLSLETGPRGWKDIQRAWKRYYPLVLCAIMTGLRQGELRALQWDSVKLDKKLLYVRRAASNTGRIKPPKSDSGYRVIDLPDNLVRELQEWKKSCPKGKFVFPNGNGRVESKSNLYKRCWLRLMEFSGVDRDLTFHSLRHYYASTLIAAKLSPKEVQVEMGHADIQTTFNIYGHLFPEDRAERRSKKQNAADELMSMVANPKIISLAGKRQ